MGKYTNWKKEPTLDDLRKDYKNAKPSHNKQLDRIKKYIDLYNESQAVEQKKGLKRKRSTYRSRLLKKQLGWIIPNIESPILSQKNIFTLTPKTTNAINRRKKNANILNHQWDKEIGKVRLINRAVRKYAIEGTCVFKVGWKTTIKKIPKKVEKFKLETDPKKIDIMLAKASGDKQLIEKMRQFYNKYNGLPFEIEIVEEIDECIVENRPLLEVKDNKAIIIDPSAKGIWSNVKFVIEILETDYATLKSSNSYFNLKYIRNYVKNMSGINTNEFLTETMQDYDEEDLFQFSDLARKKFTMYEYWGYWDINDNGTLVPIVASWVGDKLVRLEENPYAHKSIPYVVCAYEPIDDEIWGEPEAVVLEDDQKALTGTYRAMQDITNETAIGQEFIDDSIFKTPLEKQNYEAGRTVHVRKGVDMTKAIFRKSIEPVPQTLLNMKNIYNEHATLLTGVLDMDGGETRKQQSITGAPIRYDAKTNREMGILRRFLNGLEEIGNLILSMNREYLLDDYIYGKNSEQLQNIDDLDNDFVVEVDILTPAVRDLIASRILTMMQTNAAFMTPQIAALHYEKVARLWNQNDLADGVIEETFKEPSEAELLAQQLELEKMKLENKKAQIELLVKAKEMELKDAKIADILSDISNEYKDAKREKELAEAELALAQADKMEAQVDLFRQEFDLIQSGVKREWEKEDKEYQHLANLEREQVRTDREQKNIELKKEQNQEKSSKEKNLDYIREGTLYNMEYDPADDVFRNIKDKNSLDTSKYTKELPDFKKMPSTPEPLRSKDVRPEIDKTIDKGE